MRTLVAITGASSGIGAQFAWKLAPEHDLLLIARRKERLEEIARELKQKYGSRVDIMVADLAKDADSARVATRLEGEPHLALLVNNAGFGTKGYFWEASLESQEQMHKLHVMATVRLSHAALRSMVARDFGAIINVASVAAFVRSPGSASYSATKTWMTVFTEALYLELKNAHSNVSVQALCPGFTYSEFHDTLGVSREKTASPAFWLSAEQVVDASLEGLQRGKLFIVPGWRYRVLTAILTKVPASLRLALEASTGRRRRQMLTRAETVPAAQLREK
jgi:hypothetical protein